MAWFAYILYIFGTLTAGILILYFLYGQKKKSRIGSSPSARYNFVRRILPLSNSNWKLISVSNGLRICARSGHTSLWATSTILPVPLKNVQEVLTDASFILQWNSWVTSISRISVSNSKESSTKECSDVIAITETSSASSFPLRIYDSFMKFIKTDSRLYSRSWHFEEDVQFWLHSAVVEPRYTDALFTLFMVFPIKGKPRRCNLIIASEQQSSVNPNVFSATMAGLRDFIINKGYEPLLPEIKDDKHDGAVMLEEEEEDDDDVDDEQEAKEIVNQKQYSQLSSEDFVDVLGVYYSPDKDSHKYKVIIDGALKKLMENYEAKDKQNGWALVGVIKDVEILKKPASPGFSIWDCSKGTININVPIHYLLAYLDDMNNTSDYDNMYDKGQIIEILGPLTNIVHLEYKGMLLVSGRDFCSVSATRMLKDGTIAYFAKHAKHPSCPPCKKLVRGKILSGGFVMKILSEDPPCIKTTYITHVDLQGSVPSRIVNKITADQPASVGIVKAKVEKLYKQEIDNPNKPPSKFKTDAMVIYEKLQRVKEAMAMDNTSKEISEEPVVISPPNDNVETVNGDVPLNNEVNKVPPASDNSNVSPSIHNGSPFDYGGLDYKTIGNQACAGLMQEAFEVAEVDISKPTTSSVREQWQYIETEKKVLIFKKVHENEKIHSFIGKGIIACAPPRIWEILKDPQNAYRYNNMLKETRTLEKLSDTQIIEYLHFQTEKCFRKEARDFIVLRSDRKEKDRYIVSYVSVDYPNSPSYKDIKRGKVIASGWVVEPLLHNGQLYSMVTYLAQLNPGGNIPAILINSIGRKQPLCLAYLRRLIENPNQNMSRSFSQSLDQTNE